MQYISIVNSYLNKEFANNYYSTIEFLIINCKISNSDMQDRGKQKIQSLKIIKIHDTSTIIIKYKECFYACYNPTNSKK